MGRGTFSDVFYLFKSKTRHFPKKHVSFDAKRAEEKAATGQEWVALGERELLFQHAGVAVARGNSAILDTLRHAWSSGGTK